MKTLKWAIALIVIAVILLMLAQFIGMLAGGFGEVRGQPVSEYDSCEPPGQPVIANGVRWGCTNDPMTYDRIVYLPRKD